MRTTHWSVPEHLKDHIDLVHPTTMFGVGLSAQGLPFRFSDKVPGHDALKLLTSSSSPSTVNPSCNETITPACLLELYNAVDYKVQAAHKGNQIAITSYLGNFSLISSLPKL